MKNIYHYPYKSFYKIMGIALFAIGTISAGLNFLVGNPIAFLLLVMALLGFLQIRQYFKPYVTMKYGALYIQVTAFKKKTLLLEHIERVERGKHQLILTMDD
ncbi:MAG: hypothetical protein ACRBFS_18870 [Aureispira sp.]